MEIKREELEKIIEKVIKELESDCEHEEYYLVFSAPWTNLYYIALEEIKSSSNKFHALISNDISQDKKQEILKNIKWKDYYEFKNDDHIIFPPGKFVFLSLNRNNIIDIAMLTAKNFETRLVKDRIGYGEEIYYWNKGLEKVTGKEPKAYSKKLLDYYEQIFQYGIKPIEIEVVKK